MQLAMNSLSLVSIKCKLFLITYDNYTNIDIDTNTNTNANINTVVLCKIPKRDESVEWAKPLCVGSR